MEIGNDGVTRTIRRAHRPQRWWLHLTFGVAGAGGCMVASGLPAPGTVFTDCADCPAMVVVPSGQFLMGSPPEEPGRFEEEGPQHHVRIPSRLAISHAPITRAQYASFVEATHHPDPDQCAVMQDDGQWRSTPGRSWRQPGFDQQSDHPVVCVSWEDGQAYARWLTARTGKAYRLLSEAEFEYVARAGVTPAFPWGTAGEAACAHANGFDRTAQKDHPDWPSLPCTDGYATTAPVGAFPANAFGLLGTTGNVFQWVEDCWVEGGYSGAPDDGTVRAGAADCNLRVIRGGSWLNGARGLRLAMRDLDRQTDRYTNVGLRVARSEP